jgi:hypothetical protein
MGGLLLSGGYRGDFRLNAALILKCKLEIRDLLSL